MPRTILTSSSAAAATTPGLTVPPAHELEAWIETLPLADVGETRQRVSAALLNLGAGNLSGQERYASLELLRKPVHYLSEALHHHYVGLPLPLALKTRAVAAQLSELHLAMADGYQSLCDELLALDTVRQDFTMLATSLQRALYYLGQALLSGYQLYEPCGNEHWRRIHHLYEAAERKGVQSSAVKEPYRQQQSTSAAEQYIQILLLALSNPYRYAQSDMALIYSLSERWAPQCRLLPADQAAALDFACRVDLAGDAPPCSIVYSAIPHPATCRLLDTTALVQSLRHGLAPRGEDSAVQPLEDPPLRTTMRWRNLLHSLATAWGQTAKRRYSRARSQASSVAISLGLSAVHPLIDKLYAWSAAHSAHRAPGLAAAASGDEDEGYLCEVLDESAGGSRLKWRNLTPGKLRVGELIALRHVRADEDIPEIAAIRWLKNTGKQSIEFGVQLISPDAIPITVRLYNGNDQEAAHDYLKGLYIPAFKAIRQPASLILPAFLYHADDVLSLVMDDQQHRVQLVKAVETTQGYSRFYFSPLAAPQAHH